MSKTTTVGMPLPNSSRLQRVVVEKLHKEKTYIYFDKGMWHSTKIKTRIPKTAKQVIRASQYMGKSLRAQENRNELKSLMRGKIKVKQGRPSVNLTSKRKRLNPEVKKALRIHNKSLVEAFTSPRAKEINRTVHKILMKQVDGKKLTSQEKRFLDEH